MKKDVEESIFADEDEIALVAEIEDLGLDQYDATKQQIEDHLKNIKISVVVRALIICRNQMIVSGLLVCILAAVKMDQFSMTLNSNTRESFDCGVSITPTSSGNYMMVARFQNSYKTLVAILDSEGVRQKHVIVDGRSDVFSQPVTQTPNGNYLVALVEGEWSFTLMELNSTLQVQQELRLSARSAWNVRGVAQRADGEIMAITTAYRDYYYALVIRISPSFVVQEQFHVGVERDDEPRAVIATQDNGFLVVVGNSAWQSPQNMVLKYNSANSLEWGQSWKGNPRKLIRNAIQLSNSNYFFSGADEALSPTPFIVVLADSNGSIIAQKSFAHATSTVYIEEITESADGKIFMTGHMDWNRLLIVKMDSSANLEWAKYYDYSSGFIGYSIARAATGNGVVLTGETNLGNGYDIFVMEVDSDGLLTSSAGSYYPTSVTFTQSSINITNATTNGNPSHRSYKTTKEGIQFLDMEVQQTFQYPAGREGSSYVPGISDASSSLSSISYSGSNVGLIVGVVVGILALAAVIIFTVWCCKGKEKQSNSSDQHLAVQMTEPLCQPQEQPLQQPQPIGVPGVINEPSVVTVSQSGQPYAPPQNTPYTAQPINE